MESELHGLLYSNPSLTFCSDTSIRSIRIANPHIYQVAGIAPAIWVTVSDTRPHGLQWDKYQSRVDVAAFSFQRAAQLGLGSSEQGRC